MQDGWSKAFALAATIHLAGIIFYAVFASGELQPWGEPPTDPNMIPNWKIRQISIQGVSVQSTLGQPTIQHQPAPQPEQAEFDWNAAWNEGSA